MSGGVAYAAMSTCNKCGRQFPTAPAGVIHKCVCPGGMMVPDATPVQVTLVSPTPPIEGRDADVERVEVLDELRTRLARRRPWSHPSTGVCLPAALVERTIAALQALGERG